MYRKAYKDLLDWKNSKTKKPLLLLGARQVGKTWLMKQFGKNEYRNVAYINCDSEPMTKELFSTDYDINRLLIGFQALTGESIDKDNTLIIIDEIQETTRGLHSLKYFCENAAEYHICWIIIRSYFGSTRIISSWKSRYVKNISNGL